MQSKRFWIFFLASFAFYEILGLGFWFLLLNLFLAAFGAAPSQTLRLLEVTFYSIIVVAFVAQVFLWSRKNFSINQKLLIAILPLLLGTFTLPAVVYIPEWIKDLRVFN